jgi:hypothetical protein
MIWEDVDRLTPKREGASEAIIVRRLPQQRMPSPSHFSQQRFVERVTDDDLSSVVYAHTFIKAIKTVMMFE